MTARGQTQRGPVLVVADEEVLRDALSAREREVGARSLTGQTARQIAGELGLGAGTVLTYRQRAYAKTGSNKASDLLAAVMG
mgnify:CR=1 FL=1